MGAGPRTPGSQEQLEHTLNIRASLTTELWRPLLPAGRWQFCIFDEGKRKKTWGIRVSLSCLYKYPCITSPFCPRLALGQFHFLLNSQIYWGTLMIIVRQWFLLSPSLFSSNWWKLIWTMLFSFLLARYESKWPWKLALKITASLENKPRAYKGHTGIDFLFSFINGKGQRKN